MIEQARDHGRRREHRDVGIALDRLENLLGLEAGIDDLMRAARDLGEAIETGAVRQRRRMHGRVALVELVDVGVVGQAREQQIAVRQHGALRLARGAAMV